jgi:hypothetical protein
MKILRAHDYDPIMRLRSEARRVPDSWLDAARDWPLIVLPNDLSPSWIGLTRRTDEELISASREYGNAWNGRSQDDVGGWCVGEEHAYWMNLTPHIYLDHRSVPWYVHELAHALARLWHVDTDAFFRPDRAMYPYAATTPDEYFACALDAFLTPDRDPKLWNRLDLADRDQPMHDFLRSKLP